MLSKRQRYRHLALSSLLLCTLLTCLTACSMGKNGPISASTATPNGDASSPTAQQATPTVATQPVPATQTDCPAQNQGRALVTAPLAQGTQPHILYIHNDGTFNIPGPDSPTEYTGTKRSIRSYDPTTQTSKIIATALDKQEISSGTLSQDGQWLLLTTFDYSRSWRGTIMVQAIRVDGQGLQTLLCLGEATGFIASPDLHKIAFSFHIQSPGSSNTVYVLDTTTGNTTTEVDIPQKWQEKPNHDPFPSIWISNTQLLLKDIGNPDNAYTYLVDTAKGEHQTLASLPVIYKQSYSSATLIDSKELLLMNLICQPGSTVCDDNHLQSSLSVFSLQEHTAHEIYQRTQFIIRKIDVATPQSYLFLAQNPTTGTDEIWSIHSDGSQPQKLASIASHVQANQSDTFTLAKLNISNDRSQYVVDNWPTGNNDETRIYYGSVQGGPLQVIPDSTKATAIGWALL